MKKSKKYLGAMFALTASAINATIGIISILLMHSNLKSNDIAFLKTAIACILVFVLLNRIPKEKQRQQLVESDFNNSSPFKMWSMIALCSFLGIFVLFFFETMAYQYGNPANVVVILMASAAISATFLSFIFLKEKITLKIILGVALSVTGIFVISWSGYADPKLWILSSIAGLGYGAFSVLLQKFRLQGGIYMTKYLLIFGALFLFIPFVFTYEPISFDFKIGLGLLALALFPSILGFFCTTSALKHLSASKVQVLELTEPLFAMFFAWVFLNELPTSRFWIGAFSVITGVLIMSINTKEKI